MAAGHFTYRAFISYRHVERDRRWARWLLTSLETYRTPASMVRQGAPQRIGKLFRDDDEIPASSDLGNQLQQSLESSEFLIVVCSPDTPKSAWVRREITLFQRLGRGDRIIPLLVEGEPDESFPPELLTLTRTRTLEDGTVQDYAEACEPLAADVRVRSDEKPSKTRHRALIRIAAALLHCRYDDLENRERQRQLRRKRVRYGVAASLALMALVAATSWWDYSREKTRYFTEYATAFGVPVGIGPVDLDQAGRMHVAYAMHYQRRKLIRMVRQVGAGTLNPLEDDYEVDPWDIGTAEWRFAYKREGPLVTVMRYDGTGHKLVTESYSIDEGRTRATVQFRTEDTAGNQADADLATVSQLFAQDASGSRIAQHLLRFDSLGRITARSFQTSSGYPARDGLGAAGRYYRYDEDLAPRAIGFLDQADRPMTLASGITLVEIARDAQRRASRISAVDAQGNPARFPRGYTQRLQEYDTNGNVVKVSYFGLDGEPTLLEDGYAASHRSYDPSGNLVRVGYVGVDGEALVTKDKYSAITSQFDVHGRPERITYLGVDGSPVLHRNHYARRVMAYVDEQDDRLREERYLGVEGEPVLAASHIAGRRVEYPSPTVTRESYFGTDGKPILNDAGYAGKEVRVDERGRLIETTYLGVDGKAARRIGGYAVRTLAYDRDSGNLAEVGYLGTDRKSLTRNDEGFALERRSYRGGNLVSTTYFGPDRLPVMVVGGYAGLQARYDDQSGDLLEVFFTGIDGRLVRSQYGYAKRLMRYRQGREIERIYFGPDNHRMLYRNQYASRTSAYDDMGRLVEQAYFDVAGLPTLYRGEYHRTTLAYDSRGKIRELAFFGTGNQLTMSQYGFARQETEYDESGHVVGQQSYDEHDKPMTVVSGASAPR
jgi:hypothetical protein